MGDKLQDQLQDALAEFAGQRKALEQMRDELTTLSVTVRSKDRVVEVTLGADGMPTALRFLNNKHQGMSGQQLAASVLQAISLARQEVTSRVQTRMEGLVGKGLGIAGSGLKDLDLDRLLEPLISEGLVEPSGETGR